MPRQWSESPIHALGFAPDLPPQTPGVLSSTNQVFPTQRGVRVFPTPVTLTSALAAQPRGLFAGKGADGAWRVYAATTTHIYRSSSPFTSWTEYDNSQTFTMSGGFWSFVMRGNDVYATDLTDAIQKSTAAGQFQALTATSGSVPKGAFLVIVQPGGTAFFLMVLGLSTDPAGWAASGVGNDQDWGFNVATLGAAGTLGQTNGAITAAATIRGGVAVFKSRSLQFGQFVGTPFVWDFSQVISRQVGTDAPQSVVNIGDSLVFVGPDNFYLFDSYSVVPIPNGLRDWFFGTALDLGNIAQIWGRYDVQRDVVFWHYPVAGGDGTPTKWVAWSRKSGRWTVGSRNIYAAYPDVVPISDLAVAPGTFNQSRVLQYYGSSADSSMSASVVTWDIGQSDGLTVLTQARAHWDKYPTGPHSLETLTHSSAGVAPVQGVYASSTDPNGYFDFVQVARWQNLSLIFAGDAEMDAIGVAYDYAGDQ